MKTASMFYRQSSIGLYGEVKSISLVIDSLQTI